MGGQYLQAAAVDDAHVWGQVPDACDETARLDVQRVARGARSMHMRHELVAGKGPLYTRLLRHALVRHQLQWGSGWAQHLEHSGVVGVHAIVVGTHDAGLDRVTGTKLVCRMHVGYKGRLVREDLYSGEEGGGQEDGVGATLPSTGLLVWVLLPSAIHMRRSTVAH
jgi:hypothetical protein